MSSLQTTQPQRLISALLSKGDERWYAFTLVYQLTMFWSPWSTSGATIIVSVVLLQIDQLCLSPKLQVAMRTRMLIFFWQIWLLRLRFSWLTMALMWQHDLAVHGVKFLIPSNTNGKDQLLKKEVEESTRLAWVCMELCWTGYQTIKEWSIPSYMYITYIIQFISIKFP